MSKYLTFSILRVFAAFDRFRYHWQTWRMVRKSKAIDLEKWQAQDRQIQLLAALLNCRTPDLPTAAEQLTGRVQFLEGERIRLTRRLLDIGAVSCGDGRLPAQRDGYGPGFNREAPGGTQVAGVAPDATKRPYVGMKGHFDGTD